MEDSRAEGDGRRERKITFQLNERVRGRQQAVGIWRSVRGWVVRGEGGGKGEGIGTNRRLDMLMEGWGGWERWERGAGGQVVFVISCRLK